VKTVSYDGKWKGEIILFDPLTIQQEADWEYAVAAFQESEKKGGKDSATVLAFLPGVLACVSEWKLEGFPERVTVQNFPRRPRSDRANLVSFLVTEITKIYKEEEDPNE